MSTLLRQADDKFDRVNEQQTRQVLNTRLGDQETKEQRKTTSRGGLSTYQGKITLANGANNNISLDYATYVYITGPTGAFSITGIKNGEKGAFAILRNSTSQAMTIANESASSSANNRIKCPGNADIILSATNGASLLLQYDTSLNRWVVILSGSSALDRLAAALSILGRSANSTGPDADIATTSGSNAVLRESGGAIGWGLIATANITDANVTYAKIQNLSALAVMGRSANSSGVGADIAATASSGAVLRESGGAIGWGTITNAALAAGVAVANLGYTPVNKAGDTMSGNLVIAAADLQVYRSGGTTGVIFLNSAGTRYLYWDNTQYNLPGAQLLINGSTAWHDANGSTQYGQVAVNSVGQLALCLCPSSTAIANGATIAGSSLTLSNTSATSTGSTLTGTWIQLGTMISSSTASNRVSLFKRIS